MTSDVSGFSQGLITALFTAVVGSALAWLVGTQVSYNWDERRRRRESDLAALAAFYRLYGEFFATWKLWSAHCDEDYAATLVRPDQIQWTLLERAEAVEGGFEALLVKVASERRRSRPGAAVNPTAQPPAQRGDLTRSGPPEAVRA
jgi:hypothetical protein